MNLILLHKLNKTYNMTKTIFISSCEKCPFIIKNKKNLDDCKLDKEITIDPKQKIQKECQLRIYNIQISINEENN